jgi:hypothetical protein
MKHLLLILILACCPLGASQDVVVCVLFDLSQSAQNVRAAYRADFEKVVDGMAGGELVLGSAITAHSLATGRFEIDKEVPKYNPFVDSRLTYRKKLQTTQMALKQDAHKLLEGASTPTTDLLGAMQLAEKAFQGNAAASAKARLLLVFSDMVEESGQYNFRRENLTPARIASLVEAERKAGRLPLLKGVQVWVAGAGGTAPEKFLQIQDFWIQYFRAAGADLRKSHYGAGLMDFSIPRP